MGDDETGHGFDHIQRVVGLADRLVQHYPEANRVVAVTAAYLHDVIDEKLVADTAQASQGCGIPDPARVYGCSRI